MELMGHHEDVVHHVSECVWGYELALADANEIL